MTETNQPDEIFTNGIRWRKDTSVRYCPHCGWGNLLADLVWVNVVGVSLCTQCESSFILSSATVIGASTAAKAIQRELESRRKLTQQESETPE